MSLFIVEKMLCIINQQGLVEQRARDTDKRVLRLAGSASTGTPQPKWHECLIRPGTHGSVGEKGPDQRHHQLH